MRDAIDILLDQLAADESAEARHGLDCVDPQYRQMAEDLLCQRIQRTENARERLAELRRALRDAHALMAQYYTETDGCDHSVNICVCNIRDLRDRLHAILHP